MRITAVLTNTPVGVVPGQAAGLELRHRQHARVEDRIREAKATGLRNLPCHANDERRLARDRADRRRPGRLDQADRLRRHPDLARCEIAAFRYRVLHVAARITRGARQTRLRIDATWRWATHIADGFHRIRAAFA